MSACTEEVTRLGKEKATHQAALDEGLEQERHLPLLTATLGEQIAGLEASLAQHLALAEQVGRGSPRTAGCLNPAGWMDGAGWAGRGTAGWWGERAAHAVLTPNPQTSKLHTLAARRLLLPPHPLPADLQPGGGRGDAGAPGG